MHVTHFIPNGYLQTAYWDLPDERTADATPLILVHGFTGSKLDFTDHLAWFGRARRVIAYDQRGHGETTNATPYDFYSLVNDLIGLLDTLEITKAHVLGHSLGGMVAMRAALARPERFASMVLMDTSAAPLTLFPREIRTRLDDMVLERGCASLLEGMQGRPQSPVVQRGIDFLGATEHWRRIRVKLEQMDPQAFVALGQLIADHPPVIGSLASLELPTTVIVGGAADDAFIDASRDIESAIGNASLVKIADAGHNPQYENAEVWREAMDTHLAQSTQ